MGLPKIFVSVVFVCGLMVVATQANAQTTREVESKKQDENAIFRSSGKSKKSKKNKIETKSYFETRKEFEKRMKKVAEEYRKKQRKMEKPQYSDPTYFGHKRKPKIRPVGKRKLCKECGIVH